MAENDIWNNMGSVKRLSYQLRVDERGYRAKEMNLAVVTAYMCVFLGDTRFRLEFGRKVARAMLYI
jgi:hypothetical protein